MLSLQPQMIKILRHSIPLVAGSLLMLMLAVLIPKDLHHLHEHEASEPTSAVVSVSQTADDCPICDFQLLPYSFSSAVFLEWQDFSSSEKSSFVVDRLPQDLILSFSGRAPPVA